GTGTQPQAVLSRTSLSFSQQDVKTTSAFQSVTLSKTGNEALSISGIRTSSADFSKPKNCGTSVPAGGHCTIAVSFTPSTAGARTGTLTIDDEPPGSPHTVALSGQGVLRFYFAEGFTVGGFDEYLSMLVPNQNATATIDYFMPNSQNS